MPTPELTEDQASALKAIGEGRTPADEKLRRKLVRKGLVFRAIFSGDAVTHYLTDAGRSALSQWEASEKEET